MKLFEVFGEVALRGQEAVNQGLGAVEEQSRSLGDNLEAAGEKVSDLGGTMTKWVSGPIAGAITALGALGTATATEGDRIAKTARQVGMTAERYQELEYALGQVAGVSEQEVERALGRVNQRLEMARNGSTKYTDALTEIGFSQEDVASGTINAEQAFDQLVESMGNAESSSEAAGMAGELLGTRIGRRLGPALRSGSGAVDELRQEFRDLGLGMSDEALDASEKFGDRMDTLTRQFKAAGREIGAAFLPIMIQMIEFTQANVIPVVLAITDGITGLINAFSALPEPVQSVIGTITALVAVLGPALLILGKVLKIAGGLVKGIGGLVAAKGTLVTAISGITAAFGPMLAALAPFIGTAAAIAAAIAAVVVVFKNWDAIVETVKGALEGFGNFIRTLGPKLGQFIGDAVVSMQTKLVTGFQDMLAAAGDFGRGFLQVFRQLPSMVIQMVSNMASAVVTKVRNMVSGAINAFNNMRKKVVGNSIIPDMVTDVGREMDRMATEGDDKSDRFSSNVSGNLANTQSDFERSEAAGATGGGQAMNVDMRHAIIRDDRDMTDRFRRAGSEQAGAF